VAKSVLITDTLITDYFSLRRIVKDNTHRMPAAGTHPAHAVAQIYSIDATGSLKRPMMNGEGDRVPLRQRHDLGPGLHTRTLFR
jgi:hypothetical protein